MDDEEGERRGGDKGDSASNVRFMMTSTGDEITQVRQKLIITPNTHGIKLNTTE